MVKLYKNIDGDLYYFEAWDVDSTEAVIHHGKVGTQGARTTLKNDLFLKAESKVEREIIKFKNDGYTEIDIDDHYILLIEYKVDGMGTDTDLQKRHRLQDRMQGVLGWTGLGHCDGGSIGSGTMEVCCFVIDFGIAEAIIEADLEGTEFANYERIYNENAE